MRTFWQRKQSGFSFERKKNKIPVEGSDMMRRIVVVTGLLFLMAVIGSNVFAQEPDANMNKAYELWEEGFHEEAASLFLEEAEKGDYQAMAEAGACYWYGNGLEQNLDLAEEWLLKSAQGGNITGMFEYSEFLKAVYNNYYAAYTWYEAAAYAGEPEGMNRTGLCYFRGEGVEQDYYAAFSWFLSAGQRNHLWGMYNTGYCYENGIGIMADYNQALNWYGMAADAGLKEAEEAFSALSQYLGIEPDGQESVTAEVEMSEPVYEGAEPRDETSILEQSPSQAADEKQDEETAEERVKKAPDCRWVKDHFSNGRLYIRTYQLHPGTVTNPDQTGSDAYLTIGQDYESFFIVLTDADGRNLQNQQGKNVTISCQMIWYENSSNELVKEFPATMIEGGNVIRLPDYTTGYFQNAFSSAGDAIPILRIQYADNRTFVFRLPEHSDYWDVWEVISNYWYLPTYNNDIYTGSDVNPDLVRFVSEFTDLINEGIERLSQANQKVTLSNLMNMSVLGGKIGQYYKQYQMMMEHPFPREAEAVYLARFTDQLNAALFDTAYEIGSDIFRSIAGDEAGDLLDLAVYGGALLGDLLH